MTQSCFELGQHTFSDKYAGDGTLISILPVRTAWSQEELRRIDFQHFGKFSDDFQADIGHGALDSADVRSVDAGLICQILLGNTPAVPNAAQIGCESMAEVHASAKRRAAY